MRQVGFLAAALVAGLLPACSDAPPATTVVLIDVSNSTNDPELRARYLVEIQDVILPTVQEEGGMLAVQLINANPYGSDSLRLVDLQSCGVLDNLLENAIDCAEGNAAKIGELLSFVAEHIEDEGPGSDVLGALASAARVLDDGQGLKRLVIFSDLLQQVGGASVVRWALGPESSVEEIVSKMGTPPVGLEGTSVYLSGVGVNKREGLASSTVVRLLEAWTAFFAKGGATVRSTTPNLTNF